MVEIRKKTKMMPGQIDFEMHDYIF